MAQLNSPGVSVSIIDESFYVPAAPGTVPMIFVASASNKENGGGTGIAQGTLAANAGKVYLITSRRDLVDTFGIPQFYTDSQNNPVHAGEQNEYGLQAAYSLLGVTSRAYVVRADLDLAQLTHSTDAPAGPATSGTHWLQPANSLFGINEWNSTTQKFTVKTPLIIDDSNANTYLDAEQPSASYGKAGDYAVVVAQLTTNTANQYWFKSTTGWTEVKEGFDSGKSLTISPHYEYPTYTTSTDTGSVWIKTTQPGQGAHFLVKNYNGVTKTFDTVPAPLYSSFAKAQYSLDKSGGGQNIPVNSVFVETNFNQGTGTNATANFKLWRRAHAGKTTITFDTSNATTGLTTNFTIRETLANNGAWNVPLVISITGNNAVTLASNLATAINASTLTNVTATYDAVKNKMTIEHTLGGDIEIKDGLNTPLNSVFYGVSSFGTQTRVIDAPADDTYDYVLTNWTPLSYVAQSETPSTAPTDGTLWYDVNLTADIMVNDGTNWKGYLNVFPDSDPAGPSIAALAPLTQSDGTDLVTGDIWISTANMELYGKEIYVYDSTITGSDPAAKWVLSDVADNTSPEGWLFADARWSTTGGDGTLSSFEPASITELLDSDFLDPDAPDPKLYPRGLRLFNLRRSGMNVKKYQAGYIDINANDGENLAYDNETMNGETPYFASRWVTAVELNTDGSAKFGRHAQRGAVVKALKSLVQSNTTLRDTDTLIYNLMACPGYPELIQEMVALNVDIGQLSMVVGDTPFRLTPDATSLLNWGANTALAVDNGDEGATTRDEYLSMFYPSGYTSDNTGNGIVVPPSHMMLRTIINSDNKSYPWFAPAGIRRGGVDNASSVGYVDGQTGEYRTASLYQGLRDVLQDSTGIVNINPIATLPGSGLVLYGQKTRARGISALDRINVVRLICYLRRQLAIIAKPYLFEPNDAQTRREIKASMDSFLVNLVNQRALYDYVVICDNTNNTPTRIDRSELWVDIAIEPVKAVEFIYIPLRVVNTGAIKAGN